MLKHQGPAVASGYVALVNELDITATILCTLTDRLGICDVYERKVSQAHCH